METFLTDGPCSVSVAAERSPGAAGRLQVVVLRHQLRHLGQQAA
ncbi:hypothetical protein BN2537_16409 [Streptomyces venezuelae]|nr:hypothetical protein BN2537_16409 [Streptomyces venezuelae]